MWIKKINSEKSRESRKKRKKVSEIDHTVNIYPFPFYLVQLHMYMHLIFNSQ